MIVLGLMLLGSHAMAMVTPSLASEVRAGLLLQTDDGRRSAALLQHTTVSFDISGLLVRTRVEQAFVHQGDGWVEGIYSFPLPDDAAVDRLRMQIGERLIEGQIHAREEARQRYEQARVQGKRASIVEQQRPNIFTTSVANIAPGDRVVIAIEYQQRAGYSGGRFSLRFPLTLMPRYIPGTPLLPSEARIGDSDQRPAALIIDNRAFGWAAATDQVPDAALITPPVAASGEPLTHRVSLSARLKPGFALARVESRYHPVTVTSIAPGELAIELADESAIPDRDFALEWEAESGAQPVAALLEHEQDGAYYGSLMILPPAPESGATPLPRSLTLVLDISGSMHGASITQARQSLQQAIAALRPQDRFNIIVFNNRSYSLFERPLAASPVNRMQALTYIAGLEAEGGTEMAAAIKRALSQPEQPGYVEQLLFITDGAVGNEAALFNLIQARLGRQRLFTVGIGSAPNSYFMRKAAQLGRGTFTFIGSSGEVQQRMEALLGKLDAPQMTAIGIDSDEALELYPDRLPDLYPGEPLMVTFRARQRPGRLTLRGSTGERPWQQSLMLKTGAENPAISVLWGRERIAALMDDYRQAGDPSARDALRQQVVEAALAHHLVSRFTSLVAVDVTPSRPVGELLATQVEKNRLPHGTSQQQIFGLAKTATSAPLQIAMGLLLLLAAWLAHAQGRRLVSCCMAIRKECDHA
ncbi:marine proteobacterial sortase target protein [Motiliproteus sediminis]|uniref:marine proteobacterial sortase target protein n=1 Tax=Motiliproteus sediminis TaxID=1468178 RepID=UPI001AEFE49E|nr:marine proteobacterial sortase target protein [Motiliproteus sediminis]